MRPVDWNWLNRVSHCRTSHTGFAGSVFSSKINFKNITGNLFHFDKTETINILLKVLLNILLYIYICIYIYIYIYILLFLIKYIYSLSFIFYLYVFSYIISFFISGDYLGDYGYLGNSPTFSFLYFDFQHAVSVVTLAVWITTKWPHVIKARIITIMH